MNYTRITVVSMILLVAAAPRAAADSFSGVLKVIEIAEHEQDPWAVFKLQTVEDEISEHEQLIENLRRDRPADRDEAGERSAQIKKHREDIVVLKKQQRELRREVDAGMTEIRGWLGLDGTEIVIECRGKRRKDAQRLRPGDVVDFAAEHVKAGLSLATHWQTVARHNLISPLDLRPTRNTQVGWRNPQVSHVFTWSRVVLAATAIHHCEIKAETTRSGRSYTVVDVEQTGPRVFGGSQLVMEVRMRIFAQDAAGRRGQLLTPQTGIVAARRLHGSSNRNRPLRVRFAPSPPSEHGYQFEIIEVLAEVR